MMLNESIVRKIKNVTRIHSSIQKNGIAKRFNRTLCEIVRCLLKGSRMAKNYWAEAFKTATDVRNRIKIERLNEGKSCNNISEARFGYHARIWLRIFRSFTERKTQQTE
jgi:hypothetical protein